MNLKNDRIIIKNLIDKNDENNKTISLVANSGIQFIDFEFDSKIDFSSDEDNFVDKYPSIVVKGQFAPHPLCGRHFARFKEDKASNKCVIEGAENISMEKGDRYGDDSPIDLIESLNLYNGVWFPICYYSSGHDEGPINWARARIINMSDVKDRDNGGLYHVTFAFDTKLDNENTALHCAPSTSDISDVFTFRGCYAATKLLDDNESGASFVREWAKSVYEKIYPKTTNDSRVEVIKKEWLEKNYYEKHYLNLIAFLEYFVEPNNIKLMPFEENGSETPIDVSLILDVGNSRSCGILMEEDDDHSSSLLRNPQLEIRDLNAVENVYVGTFDSKIQFQKANFDFNYCSDISSRLDAFVWPSLVRVGAEAKHLSANSAGNEGNTGLISPKRYLWQFDNDLNTSEKWNFNNHYYQIPVREMAKDSDRYHTSYLKLDENVSSATYLPISRFINSYGDALFADTGDESKLLANYTGKSTMTFMLMEIIMQAMMQMNSFHYRQTKANALRPRRLKAVVLTTPPSMPDLEREVFRSCAYQAIGLIWKAYGYDKTPATEFKYIENASSMFPKAPAVILKWNETLTSQLVYLYNETQKVFGGNSLDFIKHIRRADADKRVNEHNKHKFGSKKADYVSARIASIDIGGGTTDLVIADYSYPCAVYSEDGEKKELGNQSGTVEIREILKDGSKTAGDDLVLNLIKEEIVPQLGDTSVLAKIIGTGSSDSIEFVKNRTQTVEQVFTKIAYRIISRLEKLNSAPAGTTSVIAKGTVEEFLYGIDSCEALDTNEDRARNESFDRKKKPCVDECVSNFITKHLGADYKFFEIPLEFDIYKINHEISVGDRYDVCSSLNYLNTIVNTYQCDVLILTGRPSKIPGIRTLIESNSHLSPRRIISLHEYKCGSWYPSFTLENGKIGDPKTSVVVGALLGYIKQSNISNLSTFRINPNYQEAPSPARFMGKVDEQCRLEDREVKYRFYTTAELKERKAADEGEEIDLDANYLDDNANRAKLELVSDVLSEKSLHSTLPVNLGYRQFDEQAFMATMLYHIEPYKKISELSSVKATKKWIVPDIEDIDFTPEGRAKLNTDLFCLLYPSHQDHFPDRALDIFDKAVEGLNTVESDISLAKSHASLMYGADRSALKVLDFDSPYAAVISQFDNQAMEAGNQQAATLKQTGIMAKLTNAAGKAEDKRKEGYDAYKQSHLSEVFGAIENAAAAERSKVKGVFLRELCMCVEDAINALRRKEQNKLDEITAAVKGVRPGDSGPHYFDITIKVENEALRKDSPLGKCLGFVREQEKSLEQDIFILKITNAKDTSGSGSDDCTSYLKLSLKTVSDGDEYWNNDGLILDKE